MQAQLACKAGPFLKAVRNAEFTVAAYATADVMAVAHPLSKQLQAEKTDLSGAVTVVEDAIAVLQRMRRNAETPFSQVFKEATDILRDLIVDAVVPEARICERQAHRANDSTGSPEDYHRVSAYIPLLDDLITQLETRFAKHERTMLKLG